MTSRKILLSFVAAACSAAAMASTASAAVGVGPLSYRSALTAATPGAQQLGFQVVLPLRNETQLDTLLKQQQDPASPNYHKWLTPTQFRQTYGPTAATIALAQAALAKAGFAVTGQHAASLSVMGSAAAVNQAFAATLKTATAADGTRQVLSASPLVLPPELKALGATVVAFVNKPNMHVDSRKVAMSVPANRASANGPYWFTDLRQAYGYPALNQKMSNGKYLDGTGVKVAIVMSSDALDSDVAAAFNHEKYTYLSARPTPKLTHLAIDGGCKGGTSCGGFTEASLDTQQVLGGAPGAQVSILNIPDLSDISIMDAYTYVVESNAYDVVSSSFGECEKYYTAAYSGTDETSTLRAYDALFKQGAAQGITWVASSGDSGGLECLSTAYFSGATGTSFQVGVSSPAADPSVVAVGGGNIQTTYAAGSLNSAYVSENAYGDPEVPYDPTGNGILVSGGYWGAGGGQSEIYSAPAYQSLVTTGSTARTLPDVGMQVGGCPSSIAVLPCGPNRSAVYIYANGTIGGVIGTSVSAPEFAGAVALYVQRNGRQGNLNTFLYKQGAAQNAKPSLAYYNRNIPGFDGKWSNTFPGGGYDYLVGNGTPQVRNLFGFTDLPAAGTPQTASNP